MDNYVWFRTFAGGALLTFQDRNGRRVRAFPDRGSAERFAAKFAMLPIWPRPGHRVIKRSDGSEEHGFPVSPSFNSSFVNVLGFEAE